MVEASRRNQTHKPKGKDVLAAVKELMSKQPKLLSLPLISGIASIIGFLLIVLPVGAIGGYSLQHSSDTTQMIFGVIVLWVSLFVATAVAVFFQVALVFGVNAIMDGDTPTVGWCLAQARTRLGKILSWSALAASVGVVLRVLSSLATESDNAFVAIAGWIVRILGAAAWEIASFFIVPLIVVKDVSPIAGLKESARIVKQTFGTTARTVIRFGLIEIGVKLLAVAVIVVGFLLILGGRSIVGGLVFATGIIAMIAAVVVFQAFRAALNAVLYRYSETGHLPAVQSAGFQDVETYLEATGSQGK